MANQFGVISNLFMKNPSLKKIIQRSIVESRLVFERTGFLVYGRPDPSNTIFLASSGRSGSTWLVDMLSKIPKTRQIFEPLHPLHNERVREIAGWDNSDPYIRATYLNSDGEYPEWRDLLEDVISGHVRNYWTEYGNSKHLPDRFLIKSVRANMMLGFIYKNFNPKIILLLRHPCAVVLSRLKKVQSPWYASVHDILCQEELVEVHLRPWVNLIEKEKDLLGAHAVWWAVENHVAIKQLDSIPCFILTYERLVSEPEMQLKQLISWLGLQLPEVSSLDFGQPSRMTTPGVSYESRYHRLMDWQWRFTDEEKRRILAWKDRLGLDRNYP